MWDKAKATETIVYLANRIDDPTKMKIFKLLYFADKLHMSRYGRFITGDTYVAMEHGPVPSRIYTITQEVERGKESAAFTMPDNKRITPLRQADLYELSQTEIECLDETLGRLGHLTASQLRARSHSSAWSKMTGDGAMFNNDSPSKSVPIPLELIVEELPNAAEVRELLQREGYIAT